MYMLKTHHLNYYTYIEKNYYKSIVKIHHQMRPNIT